MFRIIALTGFAALMAATTVSLAPEARAQIGNIFSDQPPRPPGNVPRGGPPQPQPQIEDDEDIGETVQFGALRVKTDACYTRPATEAANTDAFVEVDEITLQGEVKRIFSGWMYAASPGLHGVEHPIYDIWLTDCKGPDQTVVTAAPDPPKAPTPPPPVQQKRPPPQKQAAPRPPPVQQQVQQPPPPPQQRPGGLFGGLFGN
jgi:hypothetical protein